MVDLDIQELNRNSIKDFLSIKNKYKLNSLTVENDDYLKKLIFKDNYTLITPEFIDKKKYSNWTEYKVLYSYPKQDKLDELSFLFSQCSVELHKLEDYGKIDSIGLQEVDCSENGYYYILFYIILDD